MKILKYFFILLFSLLLISCSSDDDNPTETQSPLNGKWEIFQSVSGGSTPYSLETSLNLTFDGNSVSGNGTINYSRTENSTQTTVTIQNSISGSYNDPNINISVTDGTTGYLFNYIGSWNTKNVNFSGTAKIKIGDNEYTYEDVTLLKSN